MRHPTIGRWIDYVRGLASPDDAARLEQHLATRCEPCASRLSTLGRLHRVAERDLQIEVPAVALRFTRDFFRAERLARANDALRVVPTLAFDSLLAPVTVGNRTGVETARHLVYESADLVLDLFVGTDANDRDLRVGGQLYDGSSHPMSDVPIFLLQSGRVESQAVSGGDGDFGLTGAAADRSARLFLLLGDERLADIELPEPPQA